MGNHFTRRGFLWLLPAGAAAGFAPGMSGEGLDARLAEERIRVVAPRLHFILGKPLERLKSGAPVPFAFQLTLSTDRWATVLLRDVQRFVFSYDLWEERFAVARVGHPRKSASHLTQRAAEQWCVDEMSLAAAGVPEQQPIWLRLDVRAENPAEQAELDRQDTMSLTRLIDMFSRRARADEPRYSADAGPIRLAELRKPGGRS